MNMLREPILGYKKGRDKIAFHKTKDLEEDFDDPNLLFVTSLVSGQSN